MNLATRKKGLIDWVNHLDNEGLIKYLELIRNREVEPFENLSQKVKNGINKGIEQAKNGDFISHESQVEKYEKYLG